MSYKPKMTIMWKDVNDYEGFYQVSSDGAIKNKFGVITNGWEQNDYGYRKVRLYKDGKAKDFYLHRLVACAFIDNPASKPIINHIDSNPRNNKASNLEWVTQKENMQHASKNNRLNTQGVEVLNTETNKVFKSIKEAADSIGMKQNTLVYKLLGKRKNETPFVLVK